MKKFIILLFVIASVLPSLFFLLWGIVFWIMVLASMSESGLNIMTFLVFLIVPGGLVGIGGILSLTINIFVEKRTIRLSRCLKYSLVYGVISSLFAGAIFSAMGYFAVVAVTAPIVTTTYLLVMYHRNLKTL